MNKDARKKIIKIQNRKNEKFFSLLTMVFSFLLIALGILTLILIQKPIKESQELRKSAMVDNGLVKLSYQTEGELKSGKDINLTFLANTQNTQIDGVQLVFEVQGQIDNLTAQTISTSGLNEEFLEVEKQANGNWLVGVLAAKASGSFTSSSPTPFFKISFKPTSAGEVKVLLNRNSSKANVTGTYPPTDQLSKMDDIKLTITSEQIVNKDDIYFNTDQTLITFYNSDGQQIAPETLKVGQAFKVKIDYQIQNNFKESAADSQPITISYYFNGRGIATQTFAYGMLKNHQDGYHSTINLDVSSFINIYCFYI